MNMSGLSKKIKEIFIRFKPQKKIAKALWPTINPEQVDNDSESVWCVVANVVETRLHGEGREIRSGTKHFSPGTKVYCFPPLWGDGYEKVKVIGRHRGSKKFATIVMASKWLTNWRVKMVYSPYIVSKLKEYWDNQEESKAKAEELVCIMKERN